MDCYEIEANVAPSPIFTSKAGNAQHSNVEIEVKRLIAEDSIFLFIA